VVVAAVELVVDSSSIRSAVVDVDTSAGFPLRPAVQPASTGDNANAHENGRLFAIVAPNRRR
jgi:hypothetical protein